MIECHTTPRKRGHVTPENYHIRTGTRNLEFGSVFCECPLEKMEISELVTLQQRRKFNTYGF